MSFQAIIIESAQRARRLNANESRPRSLDVVDEGRPVLDWILHTLEGAGAQDPLYVGGYHIEKVLGRFPTLRVRYHERHTQEGELGALLCCEQISGPLMVINAGTILLPGACERLRSKTKSRGVYADNRSVGAYFVERADVHETLSRARAFVRHDGMAPLDSFFESLPGIELVSLDGLAAPITDREAVVRTLFRGKAQTLDHLALVTRKAAHLPRERFTVSEWRGGSDAILQRIAAMSPNGSVVVRSSARGEDGLRESSAGKYLSVLDVDPLDRQALTRAIVAVLESYAEKDRPLDTKDEVLVQPQLRDLKASGVLLTREPHSAAPYFVISEDRSSGRSDVVTSGKAGDIAQQFVAWSAVEPANLSADARRLLDLGKELIDLSRLDALDIEYAVDSADEFHLLQARPLAAAQHVPTVADEDVLDLLAGICDFVAERMCALPGLSGSTTIFGVMPDWNPAEMIGVTPRPLALSLYQNLIGDESWAEARFRLGYRDTRPERLILSLGGRPYVDVRASLNSFLPFSLDDETAGRWVDACLDTLRSNPALHDKIEFDIAVTCMAPDWDAVAARIAEAGLDPLPMQVLLRQLTQSMLTGAVEPISRQEAKLERLAERRARLLSAPRAGIHDTARIVGQLLNDCRRYGIVPFSILARYAFVSMTFLRGLVRTGAINEQDHQACLVGIPTVAGQVADDLRKGLPFDVLIAQYGHLRPNSYEITSPNYASIPEQFLRTPAVGSEPANADFTMILRTMAPAVAAALEALVLDVTPQQLFEFITGSIAGRERAKFEFTKSLNAALELSADLGDRLSFDRETTSFLEIGDLLHLETHSLTQADKTQLRRRSAFNEKRWMATRAIRLPDVIRSPEEVLSFRLEAWRANFITRKRVAGRAVWLDDGGDASQSLKDAIVITRAADPGYDWIFAHGIAGLVTEYGGLGSHMSIRAAEFGLPAAIGCGGVVIDSLRDAEAVELDCAAERVRRIS